MGEDRNRRDIYRMLYLFFWSISATLFLLFFILFILYYFTKQRSIVTFSHLFSLAFLLGASGMLILLGNHFHSMFIFLNAKIGKTSAAKKTRDPREVPQRMKRR